MPISDQTSAAAAFVLITAPGTSDYALGILYTDGALLSVAPNSGATPQLRTSAQVASLGLRLQSISSETTVYPAPAQAISNLIAPCTLLFYSGPYSDNSTLVPAIRYNTPTGSICYRRSSTAVASATLSQRLADGSTIYSRRGANARPWGFRLLGAGTGFGSFGG
jgi:hypothetical protein